jgi:hypothetical protein
VQGSQLFHLLFVICCFLAFGFKGSVFKSDCKEIMFFCKNFGSVFIS